MLVTGDRGLLINDTPAQQANVMSTEARARGEVGHTPGITVMATPRAAAAAVMPGVCSTPGMPRGGDARGAARGQSQRWCPPSRSAIGSSHFHTGSRAPFALPP